MNQTCHKVPAVLCDVHGIDDSKLGALHFSESTAFVHFPVNNLRVKYAEK